MLRGQPGDPLRLVKCLGVEAIRLHEDDARQLVSTGVEVVGSETALQGRYRCEPVVLAGGRVPEVDVSVKNAHQSASPRRSVTVTSCTPEPTTTVP